MVAFEGWNDAADAASGAIGYLLAETEAEPFAVIDPEEFFDFQSQRPQVTVDEGGTRSLTWPATRCFALHRPGEPRDLVVVLGEEPNLRWKTFARHVAQVLTETDVELVVTLGAFIGQVAHTVPVPIAGVATDPALLARHQLSPSRYEGPTGIVGVLVEACREAGLPTVSLWAGTPHYLAANSNPVAMRALLRRAAEILEIAVDTAELDEVVAEFLERIDSAMDASSDLSDYVRQLELGHNGADADGLIQDIEQYLRDH